MPARNPDALPRCPVEKAVQTALVHKPKRDEKERRCVGKNGNYDPPCGNPALHGQRRCRMHGGDPEESVIGQIMTAVEAFGLKMDVTPGEALLDLVQHKAAECHYWRAKVMTVEDLIGTENIGGMMEVERTSGSGNMGPAGRFGEAESTKSQVTIHIWYQLLRNCERDLAAYCAAAMRAGVEERAVRVAESLGMQMLSAIEEAFRQVGLTPEQQIVAGQVVPQIIRGLSAPRGA